MSKDEYTFTESLKSETILAVINFFSSAIYYYWNNNLDLFYNFLTYKIFYLTICIT